MTRHQKRKIDETHVEVCTSHCCYYMFVIVVFANHCRSPHQRRIMLIGPKCEDKEYVY